MRKSFEMNFKLIFVIFSSIFINECLCAIEILGKRQFIMDTCTYKWLKIKVDTTENIGFPYCERITCDTNFQVIVEK